MDDSHYSLLEKYWGYTTFRPLQEDIIIEPTDSTL